MEGSLGKAQELAERSGIRTMSPLIMNAGWGTVIMHSPNPSAAPVETVNLINPTIRHRYVRDPTDLDPVAANTGRPTSWGCGEPPCACAAGTTTNSATSAPRRVLIMSSFLLRLIGAPDVRTTHGATTLSVWIKILMCSLGRR
jgi:hypothetical protein